jgi:hypothetical protein
VPKVDEAPPLKLQNPLSMISRQISALRPKNRTDSKENAVEVEIIDVNKPPSPPPVYTMQGKNGDPPITFAMPPKKKNS